MSRLLRETWLCSWDDCAVWQVDVKLPADAAVGGSKPALPTQTSHAYAYRMNAPRRTIFTRICGCDLRLMEVSLDNDLAGASIRLHFPVPLLHNVAFEEDQKHLYLWVVTEAKTVHRIVFNHPTQLRERRSVGTSVSDSIFKQVTEDNFFQHTTVLNSVARDVSPTTFDATETCAVVGLSNGTSVIVAYDRQEQSFRPEFELSDSGGLSSMFLKYIPKLGKQGGVQVQTVSAVCLPGWGEQQPFAIIHTTDHRLRVWNINERKVVAYYDPGEERPATGSAAKDTTEVSSPLDVYASRVLVEDTLGRDPRLVFFTKADAATRFHFFTLGSDGSQVYFERHGGVAGVSSESLQHMSLVGDSFVAVWNTEAGPVVRSVATPGNWAVTAVAGQDFKQGEWVQGQLLESDELAHCAGDLCPVGRDAKDFYMERIFLPGRFSHQVIESVLRSLSGAEDVVEDMLQSAVITVVQSAINQYYQNQSAAHYDSLARKYWSEFLERCILVSRGDMALVGAYGCALSGAGGLVRKGGVTVFRECTSMEALESSLAQVMEGSQEVLNTNSVETTIAMMAGNMQGWLGWNKSTVDDAARIVVCAQMVTKLMSEEAILSLEEDLFDREDPVAIVRRQVLDVIGGVRGPGAVVDNGGQIPTYGFRLRVQGVMGQILNFRTTNCLEVVKELVRGLNADNIVNNGRDGNDAMAVTGEPGMASRGFVLGGRYGASVSSSACRQMITSHYRLLRSLLYFVVYLECSGDITVPPLHQQRFGDDLQLVINACSKELKTHFLMRWLSRLASAEPTSDSASIPMGALDIAAGHDLERATFLRRQSQRSREARCILDTVYKQNISQLQRNFAAQRGLTLVQLLKASACDLMTHVCVKMDVVDGKNRYLDMCDLLATQQQYLSLQEFLWLGDPSSAEFLFFSACCHVSFGQFGKACEMVIRAGSKVASPDVESVHFVDKYVIKSSRDLDSFAKFSGPSLITFRYFLACMYLFDKNKQSDCVLATAYYALNSVLPGDPMYTDVMRLLWSSIFKHSLHLGRYDEAYTSILSNPDKADQVECLRRFVVVLCEEGQQSKLCELPFVGIVEPANSSPHGTIEEVEATLKWKANTTVWTPKLNYYQILYSFQIFRGNFMDAANTMFSYAQRIENSAVERQVFDVAVLRNQADALLACLNALRLCDPAHRCILIRAIESTNKRKRRNTDEEPGAVDKEMDEEDLPRDGVLKVIEQSDIEQHYLLNQCRLRLSLHSSSYDPIQDGYRVEGTLASLLRAGMFDLAMSLALKVESGHTGAVRNVFSALVSKCIILQRQESSTPYAGGLVLENRPEPVTNEEAAKTAWNLLKEFLTKYDSAESNYDYTFLVIEKILNADRHMQLPLWLTDELMRQAQSDFGCGGSNSARLLKIYIDKSLLEDAAEMVYRVLDWYLKELEQLKNENRNDEAKSKWLPYTVIDRLKACLDRVPEASEVHGARGAACREWKSLLQNSLDKWNDAILL